VVELLETQVNKLETPVGHPDGLSLTLEHVEKSDVEQAIGKGQRSVESLSQSIEVLQRCSLLYIYQDLFRCSLPVMMIVCWMTSSLQGATRFTCNTRKYG